MSTEQYMLTEKEAARFLGIAPITLRKQRSIRAKESEMPIVPYHRYSPKCIRYSMSDLAAWRDQFRVERNP